MNKYIKETLLKNKSLQYLTGWEDSEKQKRYRESASEAYKQGYNDQKAYEFIP